MCLSVLVAINLAIVRGFAGGGTLREECIHTWAVFPLWCDDRSSAGVHSLCAVGWQVESGQQALRMPLDSFREGYRCFECLYGHFGCRVSHALNEILLAFST